MTPSAEQVAEDVVLWRSAALNGTYGFSNRQYRALQGLDLESGIWSGRFLGVGRPLRPTVHLDALMLVAQPVGRFHTRLRASHHRKARAGDSSNSCTIAVHQVVALPLARLRARGLLAEIRAADRQFTAASLLRSSDSASGRRSSRMR